MEGQHRDLLWRIIAESVEAPTADGWAAAVCVACVSVLPGVDAAALTVRADGVQETWGSSDEWAEELEQLQYTVGEGPSFEASATARQVLVPDLAADSGRWPGFAQAALPVGLAAMFAFPLHLGAIRLGVLDLYRRHPGRLPSRELTDATVLANLATVAVLEQARQDKAAGDSQLSRHAGPYQEVSIATGMLAVQLEIGLVEALARLRSRAFAEGRSVHELARDVIERKIRFDDPNGEA